MPGDDEPLDERVRRALRVERVVSEVTELRGELQSIGSRLATLRAELVGLGADPSALPRADESGTELPGTAPGSARGGERRAAARTGTAVEMVGADFAGPTDPVDLVSLDAIWGATSEAVTRDAPSQLRAE